MILDDQLKKAAARTYVFTDGPVLHKHFELLFRRLWEHIVNRPQKRIYMVVGPTGVGKSVLAREIVAKMNSNLPASARGKLPCVYVSAISEGNQAFSYKDLYIRILRELREPLVDRKIPYTLDAHGNRLWNRSRLDNRSAYTLRLAVEEAILQRGVEALIIDEAQSMIRSKTEKASYSALETIKTFNNSLGINILLLGNDELLDLQHYNDQFNRRIRQFALHAYDLKDPDELRQFLGILSSMNARFMEETGIDALSTPVVEHLMKQSAGCIGLLNDQLQDICAEIAVAPNQDLASVLPLTRLTEVQQRVIRERRHEFAAISTGLTHPKPQKAKKGARVEPAPYRRTLGEHELDSVEPDNAE